MIRRRFETNKDVNIEMKNPGVLEVPEDKKFWQLPLSHFEKLVDKKGYAKIIRALTNLEVWNKNDNPDISKKASDIADKLKKKFKKESLKRNESSFKPYQFIIDYGDGRPETIIEYGSDEEDAKSNLLKTYSYLQRKPELISKVEEVKEDHDEVTEEFLMIHQSGDGPDASGQVTFIPTAFGYDYKCTEEDFNNKGPQWSTIRTIDGIRNWFRNILFQFGAKDVFIGGHHWNINDFSDSPKYTQTKTQQDRLDSSPKLKKIENEVYEKSKNSMAMMKIY